MSYEKEPVEYHSKRYNIMSYKKDMYDIISNSTIAAIQKGAYEMT